MGTWGVAIFSNDTAADVRGAFRELIEDGRSDEDATAEVLRRFHESLTDRDDAPFFWTGLAATQYRLGRLQPMVRDRAIAFIDAGADPALWDDRKLRDRRNAALHKLRSELLGAQPPRTAIRRPRRKPSPVTKGQIFLMSLASGQEARFHVVGVDPQRAGDWPVVDLIDDRGRVYVRALNILTKVKWHRAQFELVAPRWKDLPGPEDLRIVGERRVSARLLEDRFYASWQSVREFCERALADPETLRIE